jgi:hypothetical protein
MVGGMKKRAAPDPDVVTIELMEWEKQPWCLYLNDFRIAGSKPWGGGKIIRTWKVRRADLATALERKP